MEQEPSQNQNEDTKPIQPGETNRDWWRYQNTLTTYKNVIREAKTKQQDMVVCLKKEERTFIENNNHRLLLLLRTHLPESYPTAKGNNTLPYTPTTDRRAKGKVANLQKRYAR